MNFVFPIRYEFTSMQKSHFRLTNLDIQTFPNIRTLNHKRYAYSTHRNAAMHVFRYVDSMYDACVPYRIDREKISCLQCVLFAFEEQSQFETNIYFVGNTRVSWIRQMETRFAHRCMQSMLFLVRATNQKNCFSTI